MHMRTIYYLAFFVFCNQNLKATTGINKGPLHRRLPLYHKSKLRPTVHK